MKSFPPTGVCIFLLSAGALSYEVILVRLLSMTRFHHLAFMVLSLALLAYGASGVLLAYQRGRLLRSFRIWFSIFAALFAMGTVACFQLSQRIPVFPGQWLWSPFEAVFLVAFYLVLSLPIFGAACAVGLAYCALENDAGHVYRADLLGAAAGSLAALAVLWLPEAEGLWLPWTAGLAAAALMALPVNKGLALLFSLPALLGPVLNPAPAVRLILSADKPLSIALSAEGSRKMADVFTPLGRITVIRNTLAPYRHAPGLSLAFGGLVGRQWGAFVDGGACEPLIPAAQPVDSLAYLDYLPEALPFRLLSRPRVLLLDAPAMTHLARAVARGADAVDVVVSNPGWRILFEEPAMAPIGQYFSSPRVHLVTGAPRGYLSAGNERFDLIVIGPPGPSALIADHLHTVEAFRDALARLGPGGMLSISGPSDLPPRAGLRLLSTAAAALKMAGRTDPAACIAFIRSLRSVNLIVKNEPLTAAEIAAIRTFCSRRRFDPVWFPQVHAGEANQWNRLDQPRFYEGAVRLLGSDAGHFLARYKFDVSPVFDDRPYFSRFLKPATLAELLKLRGSGALGLLSLAEPVLAVTLVQALLLSLLVVWLPLRRFRVRASGCGWGMIYLMLGTGFMLTEYAVIEKMSLFLNQPVLAVAVVLAAFLALAGLGGGISSRCLKTNRPLRLAGIAALLAAGIICVYALALPPVLSNLITAPMAARMALTLLAVTPLALVMGFPFPLAVSALKVKQAQSVPWAWGLNGCGSLIGPVLGIALAVYGGVTVVMLAAALCYAIAFAAASISAARQ
jgi:hypothetical protein